MILRSSNLNLFSVSNTLLTRSSGVQTPSSHFMCVGITTVENSCLLLIFTFKLNFKASVHLVSNLLSVRKFDF
jgi:hypothetical protein